MKHPACETKDEGSVLRPVIAKPRCAVILQVDPAGVNSETSSQPEPPVGLGPIPPYQSVNSDLTDWPHNGNDFRDAKGQAQVKPALEVAAAVNHCVFM